jgi:hypothetical protein
MPDQRKQQPAANRQSQDQIADENFQATDEPAVTAPERQAEAAQNERAMHSRGADYETSYESGKAQARHSREK